MLNRMYKNRCSCWGDLYKNETIRNYCRNDTYQQWRNRERAWVAALRIFNRVNSTLLIIMTRNYGGMIVNLFPPSW